MKRILPLLCIYSLICFAAVSQPTFKSPEEAKAFIKTTFDTYFVKSKVGYTLRHTNIINDIDNRNYVFEFVGDEIRIFYGALKRTSDYVYIMKFNKIEKVYIADDKYENYFTNSLSLVIQSDCKCIRSILLPNSKKNKDLVLSGEKNVSPEFDRLEKNIIIPFSINAGIKIQNELNSAIDFINNKKEYYVETPEKVSPVENKKINKYIIDSSEIYAEIKKFTANTNILLKSKTDVYNLFLKGKIKSMQETLYDLSNNDNSKSIRSMVTYKFNTLGYLQERAEDNFKDTTTLKTTFTYNSNGQVVSIENGKETINYFYGKGDHRGYSAEISITNSYKSTKIFDRYGNSIRIKFEDDGDTDNTDCTNYYDANNNIILDSTKRNGVFSGIEKYEYNGTKLNTLSESYDSNGMLTWSCERKFDTKGNLTYMKYFYLKGSLTISDFQYGKFDSEGNWTQRKEIDKQTGNARQIEREISYYGK